MTVTVTTRATVEGRMESVSEVWGGGAYMLVPALVFSGCNWTGCIMEAVLALTGRSSLIRVCQGINRPAKTNQADGEKARSVSVNTTPPTTHTTHHHHHTPSPTSSLTETSHQFTVKISLQETCGWLEILIRVDFI